VKQTIRYRLLGLAAVGVVAAVAVVVVGAFNQWFTPVVAVRLYADRSGLLMDKGNRVELRGVQIGRIGDVTLAPGNRTEITLDLEPSEAARLPVNVAVSIVPATIFGNKYVELAPPAHPAAEYLRAGSVLDAGSSTTVEVNDVFENLNSLLTAIQPEKLDATLSALAQALNGRGAQIGQTIDQLNQYLPKLNRDLPALQGDMGKTAAVANLYGDVAPELLDLLKNATVTSGTIVDKKAAIKQTLEQLTEFSEQVGPVLQQNEDSLVTTLNVLRPTTSLLQEYSPEFTCFLEGAAYAHQQLHYSVGGVVPGATTITSFLPGQNPYKYPQNLPADNETAGPSCYGLPRVPTSQPAPHVSTGGGADINPYNDNALEVGNPPLVVQLFGPAAAEQALKSATSSAKAGSR
jgi:phospholipid/cholesterol/gamma-HCH transport system substrate-binding protein